MAATAVLVGCGGLGCPLAQYLAAAGVGPPGPRDVVEASNLARQVLHGEALAVSQGLFGSRRPAPPQFGGGVRALRPGADAGHGAGPRPPRYDVVADCSDNAPTRYLSEQRLCSPAGPGVRQRAAFRGQLTVYHYGGALLSLRVPPGHPRRRR